MPATGEMDREGGRGRALARSQVSLDLPTFPDAVSEQTDVVDVIHARKSDAARVQSGRSAPGYSPVMRPSGVRSMRLAAGVTGRPGSVSTAPA